MSETEKPLGKKAARREQRIAEAIERRTEEDKKEKLRKLEQLRDPTFIAQTQKAKRSLAIATLLGTTIASNPMIPHIYGYKPVGGSSYPKPRRKGRR